MISEKVLEDLNDQTHIFYGGSWKPLAFLKWIYPKVKKVKTGIFFFTLSAEEGYPFLTIISLTYHLFSKN